MSSVNYDFFKCSDTNCSASGKYCKTNNLFKPEGLHNAYENHSYIIPEIFNSKFKKNELGNFNLDSEDKILCFFRTYFKHFNETCEMAKDKFKQYYPLIDIDDINLQNKINNIYIYSQKKYKDRRSILEKLSDLKDEKGDKISLLY